jgi:hypothetical protein
MLQQDAGRGSRNAARAENNRAATLEHSPSHTKRFHDAVHIGVICHDLTVIPHQQRVGRAGSCGHWRDDTSTFLDESNEI